MWLHKAGETGSIVREVNQNLMILGRHSDVPFYITNCQLIVKAVSRLLYVSFHFSWGKENYIVRNLKAPLGEDHRAG